MLSPSLPLLAVESSCDESAAAVFDKDGRLVSEHLYSQIGRHEAFGGVVPELASREHLKRLPDIVDHVLSESGIEPASVAVTRGPGLIGSLLIGVSYAKAFGFARAIPAYPVHHIRGHIAAVWLDHPEFKPPFLALIVSGGHTELIHCDENFSLSYRGRTIDDAAGEAFDKAARMLEAGYPGGPALENLASKVSETPPRLCAPVMPNSRDFSFSGLKTALKTKVDKMPALSDDDRCVLAASFQDAVIETLVRKSRAAIGSTGVPRFLLAGGVAANSAIRSALKKMAEETSVEFAVPRAHHCTDNAAMIGKAALTFPSEPLALTDSADPGLKL